MGDVISYLLKEHLYITVFVVFIILAVIVYVGKGFYFKMDHSIEARGRTQHLTGTSQESDKIAQLTAQLETAKRDNSMLQELQERERNAKFKSLAGEWKGTIRGTEGSRAAIPLKCNLMIVEHMHRCPSGIVLYDAHDQTNNKRLFSGVDELEQININSDPVKEMRWKPTFRRYVHWQPIDDPRPIDRKELDEKGYHTYKWDVDLVFTDNRAQRGVAIF